MTFENFYREITADGHTQALQGRINALHNRIDRQNEERRALDQRVHNQRTTIKGLHEAREQDAKHLATTIEILARNLGLRADATASEVVTMTMLAKRDIDNLVAARKSTERQVAALTAENEALHREVKQLREQVANPPVRLGFGPGAGPSNPFQWYISNPRQVGRGEALRRHFLLNQVASGG